MRSIAIQQVSTSVAEGWGVSNALPAIRLCVLLRDAPRYGSFLGMVSRDCIKEGNLFFVLAGIASIVLLALSFLGFKNALRTSAVQRF
jgi:hypothetical protein